MYILWEHRASLPCVLPHIQTRILMEGGSAQQNNVILHGSNSACTKEMCPGSVGGKVMFSWFQVAYSHNTREPFRSGRYPNL